MSDDEVLRISKVFPHEQVTVTAEVRGWIKVFMTPTTPTRLVPIPAVVNVTYGR